METAPGKTSEQSVPYYIYYVKSLCRGFFRIACHPESLLPQCAGADEMLMSPIEIIMYIEIIIYHWSLMR
jgi:hypothetical protein